MRVLVYNRWIATLGGGEQTLGAFAETLAKDHHVDVVTHEQPDWGRFRRVLGFDLAGIGTRVVPHDADHYRGVSVATRDYDLFVNCSYLDHVRAFARLNVMQVFFPPAPPADGGTVRPMPGRQDAPSPGVRAVGGLYPLERDGDAVFAWSDGNARFALHAVRQEPVHLTIRLGGTRAGGAAPIVTVYADDVPLTEPTALADGYVDLHAVVPATLIAGRRPVFVDVRSDAVHQSVACGDPRPVFGVRVAAVAAAHRAPPHVVGAVGLDRWTDHCRYYDALSTYDVFLANSRFTQRWIALRFGRASTLLYPPVQVDRFRVGEKRPRIISVGRFFVEGHSKKQLHMVNLFKRLCDGGLRGWEYHLVGGTRHDPSAARYLETCRAAAAGYPIVFHPDAPLHTLVELYAASRLYWNATGYGEDPETEPDRFEHFGMTTVEAMASGCVPLSYARAGQPEVIEPGWSGELFETLDELGAATLRLVHDPDRLARMAAAAVERSRTFSYERFRTGLRRVLADTSLDAASAAS